MHLKDLKYGECKGLYEQILIAYVRNRWESKDAGDKSLIIYRKSVIF